MALRLLTAVPSSSFIRSNRKGTSNRSNVSNLSVVGASKAVATANVSDKKIGESFNEQAIRLVGEVRMMLENVIDPLEKLELIGSLQRLGLSYHFQNETKRILEDIHLRADQSKALWKEGNLYATALEFRLLRQHGYNATQEVFSGFMDEMGNFKSSLCEDCKGLLNLYEASHLSMEGEGILDIARDFAAKQLQQHLKQKQIDEYVRMLLEHALELPLHWRVSRLEARWFIDVYEKREERNPMLLELAKLDFNIVQAAHQDDLRYVSKWWRDIGLGEKLPFARDRLMENFLWAVGVAFDPQFGNLRITLTKIASLITSIDDLYDVYGTLDELELFTQAVERWDINAMELLPEYMEICFFALYNSINEIAFGDLKEHGFHTIPFLKKAVLMEAKWYHSGYIPTFKEYIDNAWISISGPDDSNLIYCSSMILRLADDLGTSVDELEGGDVPKSIQCYMRETGCSEVEAREQVKTLIDATWKRMNEEYLMTHSSLSLPFKHIALNIARMAQCMYQYGDGLGVANLEPKDRVLLLLVLSIPYGEKLI
ncbi:terpene synthase 10-like [Gossypium australe]|uniref:Terpene synthase 10-like n=1 Tax=Gossypium australe TaxID=47621 RepID=A0A5B6UF80_9ROSI|nr:terpene synthase 10-like [Gossypium australe]